MHMHTHTQFGRALVWSSQLDGTWHLAFLSALCVQQTMISVIQIQLIVSWQLEHERGPEIAIMRCNNQNAVHALHKATTDQSASLFSLMAPLNKTCLFSFNPLFSLLSLSHFHHIIALSLFNFLLKFSLVVIPTSSIYDSAFAPLPHFLSLSLSPGSSGACWQLGVQ